MSFTAQRRTFTWNDVATRRPWPVYFTLYASKRVGGALCPALLVRKRGVEVIRILDPEHKQPFFSLEGVFLLAGLTINQGLQRFDLRRDRDDYDLTLAGLEPREAIWAPWRTTQNVAQALGLFDVLQTFLSVRHAWSLDEQHDGGITHNWRVTSDDLSMSSYSLTILLDRPLANVKLLSRGQQIRTLISDEQRQAIQAQSRPLILYNAAKDAQTRFVQAEQKLLRWAVQSKEQCDEIRDGERDDAFAERDSEAAKAAITPADLVMFLTDLIPTSTNGIDPLASNPVVNDQVHLTVDDLNKARDKLSQSSGDQDLDARVSFILAHQVCQLYLAIAGSNTQDELNGESAPTEKEDVLTAGPQDHLLSNDGAQKDVKDAFVQLFRANRRLEAKLDSLQAQFDTIPRGRRMGWPVVRLPLQTWLIAFAILGLLHLPLLLWR